MSLQTAILSKSGICCLPVIEAAPSEMATIYTIFNHSQDLADRRKLDTVMLVADQDIYAKAQQIRWYNAVLTNQTFIHLGKFHATMSLLSIIGKRIKGNGLQDILAETGIAAEGSVNGVSSVHHYSCSMRFSTRGSDGKVQYEDKGNETVEHSLNASLKNYFQSNASIQILYDYSANKNKHVKK